MNKISAIRNGDKRGAAKLISMLENNDPEAMEILKDCPPLSNNPKVIGITGAPGAGKSTLTDQLAKHLVLRGNKIGIIAVDPSSPISGGAFLGDRIRMSDLNTEPNVFIRSMATRGALGGISKAVAGAVRVMTIFGADYIFIETVGIGQSEVDVAGLADTVVLVVVPGMGDDIQAEKAGILEVSDIIAVNKADHEDTDRTIQQLTSMLGLRMRLRSGAAPGETLDTDIIRTIATDGIGIPDLVEAIDARHQQQTDSGRRGAAADERLKAELRDQVYAKIESEFAAFDKETFALSKGMETIRKGQSDPYSISGILLEEYMKWRTTSC